MKIVDILNEADDPMGYLGDIGARGPHGGSPVQDPGAFPGLPGGGSGRARTGASVWRGPGGERMAVPRPLQKPRVEPPSAAQRQSQELLKGQGFKQTPADIRNANVGAKVWRRGEPEPLSPPPQTPQEKLVAAAQAQARATGEPVITLAPGGLASRMLDKFFPEPKYSLDSKLKDKSEPRSDMTAHQDYWSKAMPVDTIGGKVVDKLMGLKEADPEEKPSYTKEQYLQWAKQYSDQYKVPLSLVLHSMFIETGWLKDPEKMRTAKSPTGARGVMQIQPEYAEKGYGIKVKDLTDPQKNIEAGVRGLARYLEKYGTPENALAAYNAGPGGARKFIKTGDLTFLKPETRNYIRNYRDDLIHNLQKFYPKDKQKVAQVANDILGTVVGAKQAQAQDKAKPQSQSQQQTDQSVPIRGKPAGSTYTTTDTQGRSVTYTKNSKGQWVSQTGEIMPMPDPSSGEPKQSRVVPPANKTNTLKITPSMAQKLPPVDLFGHIFPSIDWNKQGGIGGASTKPYTLPDGTVITSKRDLQNIRSLQKAQGVQTQERPVSKEPAAKPDLTPDQEAEQERRMDAIGDKWRQEKEQRARDKEAALQKERERKVRSSDALDNVYKGSPGAQKIKSLNPDIIKDVNKIYTGDTIQIPGVGPYKIQKGDTLDAIARKQLPQQISESGSTINTELTEILKLSGMKK